MDHLVQLYQPDFTNFSIPNTIQALTNSSKAPPVTGQSDSYLKEIECNGKKYRSCTFPGCGKVFRYKSEIIRHKSTHTTQGHIYCPFLSCAKTFKREDALKTHIRMHTGETPYQCKEPGCGMSFSSRGGLKYHSLKHIGNKPYTCSFEGCNKTFITLQQLIQHETAVNYHQKVSAQAQWYEIKEYNISDVEIRRSNDNLERQQAEEKLQKNLRQDEKSREDEEEELERILKIVVKENNAMKEKLQASKPYNGLTQEKEDWESRCTSIFEFEEQKILPFPELPTYKNFAFLHWNDHENLSNFCL